MLSLKTLEVMLGTYTRERGLLPLHAVAGCSQLLSPGSEHLAQFLPKCLQEATGAEPEQTTSIMTACGQRCSCSPTSLRLLISCAAYLQEAAGAELQQLQVPRWPAGSAAAAARRAGALDGAAAAQPDLPVRCARQGAPKQQRRQADTPRLQGMPTAAEPIKCLH